MDVLNERPFMLVWIVEEELCCLFCFWYVTFFNIYYVNLNIVRNNWLTVVGRQQPRFASLMAKLWDQGSKFPCKRILSDSFTLATVSIYFSLFTLSNYKYCIQYFLTFYVRSLECYLLCFNYMIWTSIR